MIWYHRPIMGEGKCFERGMKRAARPDLRGKEHGVVFARATEDIRIDTINSRARCSVASRDSIGVSAARC